MTVTSSTKLIGCSASIGAIAIGSQMLGSSNAVIDAIVRSTTQVGNASLNAAFNASAADITIGVNTAGIALIAVGLAYITYTLVGIIRK